MGVEKNIHIPPKVNQAEGILSGFVKEREEIMQQMQPSVRPKPSVRRPKQKAAKEQSPTQDNAAGGGPPPPPPPGGSGGGGGPPPPPPPPHGGGHAGHVPTQEMDNSESLPSPPILTPDISVDFDPQVVFHPNLILHVVHVVESSSFSSFIPSRITQ